MMEGKGWKRNLFNEYKKYNGNFDLNFWNINGFSKFKLF